MSTDFMQIYQQRWKATNNIYANKTFSFRFQMLPYMINSLFANDRASKVVFVFNNRIGCKAILIPR